MEFPRRTPREGGRPLTWTWVDVKHGESWRGWLAGKTVWVEAHYIKPHKPCRTIITNGGLECQLCSVVRMELIGYMPIWDESGRPLVIIVKGYSYDAVESLSVGREVSVSKGKKDKDPVIVRHTGSTVKWHSSNPAKLKPQKIEDWLLVFWADDELKRWFAEHGTAPTQAADLDAPIPKMGLRSGNPADPVDRALDKLKARRVLSERDETKYQEYLHQHGLKESAAAPNGKPKTTGEG